MQARRCALVVKTSEAPCTLCRGRGYLESEEICLTCDGSGTLHRPSRRMREILPIVHRVGLIKPRVRANPAKSK
jgi:DnaJ-class molecular chaperone